MHSTSFTTPPIHFFPHHIATKQGNNKQGNNKKKRKLLYFIQCIFFHHKDYILLLTQYSGKKRYLYWLLPGKRQQQQQNTTPKGRNGFVMSFTERYKAVYLSKGKRKKRGNYRVFITVSFFVDMIKYRMALKGNRMNNTKKEEVCLLLLLGVGYWKEEGEIFLRVISFSHQKQM